jgi:hypothetical protein
MDGDPGRVAAVCARAEAAVTVMLAGPTTSCGLFSRNRFFVPRLRHECRVGSISRCACRLIVRGQPSQTDFHVFLT